MRDAESLSTFKSTILNILRPPKKVIFDILNRVGTRRIFQLRVGLSPLKAHKMSHNFADTPVDTCPCLLGSETTLHFFLKCQKFDVKRRELL